MKHSVNMYDLLLSCPGDAYEECYPAVKRAIDAVNSDPQLNQSITISLKHWLMSSYPQSGGSAQEMINSQIVDTADLAIAVFWTRFGTPTDKYDSGTEEEIDSFIKSNKQVFLYFLDKPVPPSLTDKPEYAIDRRKIIDFQNRYKGSYYVVKNEEELQRKIEDHLRMFFANEVGKDEIHSKKWFRYDTRKEIKSNELVKFGNYTFQIDDTIARVEMIKPDGKSVYVEMDTNKSSISNIVAEGFPIEYVVEIPENLIINKQNDIKLINGTKYRIEFSLLKFNGYVIAIYDFLQNKLHDIKIQAPVGMSARIDTTNKRIYFISKQ